MHIHAFVALGTQLLTQVLQFKHPADGMVSQFVREHRQLGPRERHALSDAVFTVLRDWPRYQALMASRPDSLAAHEALAWLALVPHAQAQGWAHAPEAASTLAWAELALARTDWPAHVTLGLAAWLAQALGPELGDELPALALALKTPAPLDLRVNLLQTKRPAAMARLAAEAVACEPTPYSPWGVRLHGKLSLATVGAYQDGWVEVQDEGSQLLALLLQPKRNDTVVDFCAGAGGKTLALGAMMRNTGRLYAMDTSAHRIDALKPRAQKSGIREVHNLVLAHEHDDRLDRMAGKVDRVLVDAPCSGLGTLRRNPDLQWRQSAKDIAALQTVQLSILRSAAHLVKPGGRLVYATCSLLTQENEAVAQAFEADAPEWVKLDAAEVLHAAGVEAAAGLCRQGYMRLWPHRHHTDGFFAAVWQRR